MFSILTQSTQEVAEYNINAMLHQLDTGTEHFDGVQATITEIPDVPFVNKSKIYLMPCDPDQTLLKKREKYSRFYHAAYVSVAMAHRVPQIAPLLATNAVLTVEKPTYF